MGNNIHQDESWGPVARPEPEDFEGGFGGWDREPVNGAWIINNDPVEEDITGWSWSNEVFFRYA